MSQAVYLQWDMALLQYLDRFQENSYTVTRSVFSFGKGIIFRGTIATVARKFNPQINTTIQPKRPPRKIPAIRYVHIWSEYEGKAWERG